jgi:hypothetical protein
MSRRVGSPHAKKNAGPSTRGGGASARREWEAHLLAKLIEQVQPTPEEMKMIDKAVVRWGTKGPPTVCEILGDVRPGIESIVSLVAQGVEPAVSP